MKTRPIEQETLQSLREMFVREVDFLRIEAAHIKVIGSRVKRFEERIHSGEALIRELDRSFGTDSVDTAESPPSPVCVTPWGVRAQELEPIHGSYCVYAAWLAWIEAWNERQGDNMRIDLDRIDSTALFAAFQSACSETRLSEEGKL